MNLFSALLLPVLFSLLLLSCATDKNPANSNQPPPIDTTHKTVVLPPADTLSHFNPDSIPDSAGAALARNKADSCMQRLISTMKELDSVQTIDDYVSKDFTGCRECFESVLNIDSRNATANFGYSVAAVMALNADPQIHKMLDSLDRYFNDTAVVAHKTVLGVNYGLLAKAPLFAKQLASNPTWPTFVTVSYIQGIMDSSVVPILSNVHAALRRFEASPNPVCDVVDQGDTVEFDLGEAYVLHSMVLGMRAAFLMMTTYNVDLYKDAYHPNFSWIDDLVNSVNQNCRLIKVSGDTLYDIWNSADTAGNKIIFRMLKYNYNNRSDFLTLRRQNHALVLSDLKSTADLLDGAINAIRGESNLTQDYDLIKVNDLLNLDNSLLKTYNDLKDKGLSEGFSNHFKTPENLVSFIRTMLNGPYTFDETIDSTHVRLVINLSAFYTHPVTDLRSLMPYFRFADEATWVKKEANGWGGWPVWGNAWVYLDQCQEPCFTMNIPSSLIADSMRFDSCSVEYMLDSSAVHWEDHIDSSTYVDPIVFTDAASHDLNKDSSDFFPVFKDPTFNGMFPEMTTSQAWEDFIKNLFGKPDTLVAGKAVQ